jgi:hypothetical protein
VKSKFEGVFGNHKQVTPQGRTEPRQGRPPGKRSNPDFTPRTVLMRNELHLRVTDILRHQTQKQDLSDLIGMLLEDWVKARHKSALPSVQKDKHT